MRLSCYKYPALPVYPNLPDTASGELNLLGSFRAGRRRLLVKTTAAGCPLPPHHATRPYIKSSVYTSSIERGVFENNVNIDAGVHI